MIDKIRLYADRIEQIIEETEALLCDEYESDYSKERAKISAYNEIINVIKGE